MRSMFPPLTHYRLAFATLGVLGAAALLFPPMFVADAAAPGVWIDWRLGFIGSQRAGEQWDWGCLGVEMFSCGVIACGLYLARRDERATSLVARPAHPPLARRHQRRMHRARPRRPSLLRSFRRH